MTANETPRGNGALDESAGRRICSDSTGIREISPADSRTAFQPMPPLDPAQYDALRADIAEHGIVQPVVVDQHGRILDGNNRVQIARDLGIDYAVVVERVTDEDDAYDRAVTLNCARRHMTREQQREVIRREIARRPDDSDRAIARRVGCSPSTVGTVRRPAPEGSKLDSQPWAPPSDADPADFDTFIGVYGRMNLHPDLPRTDADYEWAQTAILYDADSPLWFHVAIALGAGRAELVAAVIGRMALWKARGMDRAQIRRLFDPWIWEALSDEVCTAISADLADFVTGADDMIELALHYTASIPRYPSEVTK